MIKASNKDGAGQKKYREWSTSEPSQLKWIYNAGVLNGLIQNPCTKTSGDGMLENAAFSFSDGCPLRVTWKQQNMRGQRGQLVSGPPNALGPYEIIYQQIN